jgi:rRNA maturation RNase YbeY
MSKSGISFVIRNRQRTRRIDLAALRRMVRAILAGPLEAGRAELCFHLVGAVEITRLNESYLGHEGSTDVITFDHTDLAEGLSVNPLVRCSPLMVSGELNSTLKGGHQTLAAGSWPARDPGLAGRAFQGEIYLSVDAAVAQARQFRTTWQAELVRYVIHGLLHLAGHDDRRAPARRQMKREEDWLLRWVRRQFSLAGLAGARN